MLSVGVTPSYRSIAVPINGALVFDNVGSSGGRVAGRGLSQARQTKLVCIDTMR